MTKNTGLPSGDTNRIEARHFQNVCLHPHGFTEWIQSEHTHENASARSRLDRIYSNMSICEQQDRHIECVALQWPYGLSAHRPVHFARVRSHGKLTKRPIPLWTVGDPRFSLFVTEQFQILVDHEGATNSFDKLRILKKKAIRKTCFALERESKIRPSLTVEEKLATCIRARRALLSANQELWKCCVRQFDQLSIAGAHPFQDRISTKLVLVHAQQLIVKLANSDVQQRVGKLKF